MREPTTKVSPFKEFGNRCVVIIDRLGMSRLATPRGVSYVRGVITVCGVCERYGNFDLRNNSFSD